MDFFNKRICLRRLELSAIMIRLNSSLPAKFGNRFMFFDMTVLSQVSECNQFSSSDYFYDTQIKLNRLYPTLQN